MLGQTQALPLHDKCRKFKYHAFLAASAEAPTMLTQKQAKPDMSTFAIRAGFGNLCQLEDASCQGQ